MAELTLSVENRIRRMIEQGKLKPGQLMPSERRFAQTLNVSRVTVRRAIEGLVREGVIGDRPGKRRRFIAPRHPAASAVRDSVLVITIMYHDGRVASAPVAAEGGVDDLAGRLIRQRGLNAVHFNPEVHGVDALANLLCHRPRGVMVPSNTTLVPQWGKVLTVLRGFDIPVVVRGDAVPVPEFDCVNSPHDVGCQRLTRLLLERGCRRILRLYEEDTLAWDWPQQREAGHRRALAAAGLEPLPPVTVRRRLADRSSIEEDLMEVIYAGTLAPFLLGDHPIDALMACSDSAAAGVAAGLRRLSITPGIDLPFTGYDNLWPSLVQSNQWPDARRELTATIDKNHGQVTARMLEILEDRWSGRLRGPGSVSVVEPTLVIPAEATAPRLDAAP